MSHSVVGAVGCWAYGLAQLVRRRRDHHWSGDQYTDCIVVSVEVIYARIT